MRVCSPRELVHYGLETERRDVVGAAVRVLCDKARDCQEAGSERTGEQKDDCLAPGSRSGDAKCAGLVAAEGNDRSNGEPLGVLDRHLVRASVLMWLIDSNSRKKIPTIV